MLLSLILLACFVGVIIKSNEKLKPLKLEAPRTLLELFKRLCYSFTSRVKTNSKLEIDIIASDAVFINTPFAKLFAVEVLDEQKVAALLEKLYLQERENTDAFFYLIRMHNVSSRLFVLSYSRKIIDFFVEAGCTMLSGQKIELLLKYYLCAAQVNADAGSDLSLAEFILKKHQLIEKMSIFQGYKFIKTKLKNKIKDHDFIFASCLFVDLNKYRVEKSLHKFDSAGISSQQPVIANLSVIAPPQYDADKFEYTLANIYECAVFELADAGLNHICKTPLKAREVQFDLLTGLKDVENAFRVSRIGSDC